MNLESKTDRKEFVNRFMDKKGKFLFALLGCSRRSLPQKKAKQIVIEMGIERDESSAEKFLEKLVASTSGSNKVYYFKQFLNPFASFYLTKHSEGYEMTLWDNCPSDVSLTD